MDGLPPGCMLQQPPTPSDDRKSIRKSALRGTQTDANCAVSTPLFTRKRYQSSLIREGAKTRRHEEELRRRTKITYPNSSVRSGAMSHACVGMSCNRERLCPADRHAHASVGHGTRNTRVNDAVIG